MADLVARDQQRASKEVVRSLLRVRQAPTMTLQPKDQHPHGISDRDSDGMFTRDRPVIFASHGYPYLIHRLTYNRTNHAGM
jgi:phosphoketolase